VLNAGRRIDAGKKLSVKGVDDEKYFYEQMKSETVDFYQLSVRYGQGEPERIYWVPPENIDPNDGGVAEIGRRLYEYVFNYQKTLFSLIYKCEHWKLAWHNVIAEVADNECEYISIKTGRSAGDAGRIRTKYELMYSIGRSLSCLRSIDARNRTNTESKRIQILK
jgi:hypothetical protein